MQFAIPRIKKITFTSPQTINPQTATLADRDNHDNESHVKKMWKDLQRHPSWLFQVKTDQNPVELNIFSISRRFHVSI